MAAICPAKAIAVWSGARRNTVGPDFIDLLLKSGKCFIQATGGQFFAWRTGRGQNVELVGDGGEPILPFLPQVIEEPWPTDAGLIQSRRNIWSGTPGTHVV